MTGSTYNRGTKSRPNWEWACYFGKDANGKAIRKTKSGFRTMAEAQADCHKAIDEHKAKLAAEMERMLNPVPAQSEDTLREYMRVWLGQVECEPKTRERFRELAAYFLPVLGDTKLKALRLMQIETEMNRLKAEGGRHKRTAQIRPLSAKSVQAVASVLRMALRDARRLELIDVNPMADIKLPKVQKPEKTALDHEQFNRLLERAKTSWIYPLLAVAGATACRRGELLALTWSDIDFNAGTMEVSKSLEQTREGLRVKPPKNLKPRTVDLPSSAIEVLREHRAAQLKGREAAGEVYNTALNLVFADALGEYRNPGSVSAMAARIAKTAGFSDVSLHSLRHSHGSQLLADGVPITEVSARLGHADANITLGVYSHALESNKSRAAQVWEAARRKVAKGKSRKSA